MMNLIINLLAQLKEIKDRKNLVTESFHKFIDSVNFYWNESMWVDDKIDNLWQELNSIKILKDSIHKEIKEFYLNTPDEKLPELIGWDNFKFFDDFEILREIGYPKIRFMIPALFEMLADIT